MKAERRNLFKMFSQRITEPATDELSNSQVQNRANVFLTQKELQHNFAEIQKHHQNLNNYIQFLQQKVNKKVEENEAQIMIAYKNHITMVKKDIEELKKQTMAHANNSNSYVEEIAYLQKKLSIFRDQSLRLFAKLTEKDKEIEEMRLKMEEMVGEKKYMDESIKSLTKCNKQLEAEISHASGKRNGQQPYFTQKYDISISNLHAFQNKTNMKHKNRTAITSANISKAMSHYNNVSVKNVFEVTGDEPAAESTCELFAKKLRIKLSYLDIDLLNEVMRQAEQTFSEIQKKSGLRLQSFQRGKSRLQRATRISMRSKSNYTVDYNQQSFKNIVANPPIQKQETQKQLRKFNMRQQMSGYFMKCVQTIKKDITRRKEMNSLNFYKQGNPISFQQFKKIDCFRLMELALASEKVKEGLYNLLLEHKE